MVATCKNCAKAIKWVKVKKGWAHLELGVCIKPEPIKSSIRSK
jgi:hypothetical protein